MPNKEEAIKTMPNFGKSAPRPKTGAAKGAPRRSGSAGFQGSSAAPKKSHRKGATDAREMSGRKPDRGSNWEPRGPKTDSARKPRHTAEDRVCLWTSWFPVGTAVWFASTHLASVSCTLTV